MTDTAQLRTVLEQYRDPYLRQSLGEAGALRDIRIDWQAAIVEVVLGIPVGGYENQFREALQAHMAAQGQGALSLRLALRSSIVATMSTASAERMVTQGPGEFAQFPPGP